MSFGRHLQEIVSNDLAEGGLVVFGVGEIEHIHRHETNAGGWKPRGTRKRAEQIFHVLISVCLS